MPPDAGYGHDSSDSEAEEDSGDMGAQKVERASSDERSPSQGGKDENGNNTSSKANTKDANRPKRKKARRACHACQRAHLTCGDERPCLRCIKRGLQDSCHDGVRKKAKYLHDAPPEALVPNFAGNHQPNGSQSGSSASAARQYASQSIPSSQPGAYYSQTASNNYARFTSVAHQGQIAPSDVESVNVIDDYTNQPLETSTQFYSDSPQQISPAQNLPATLDQSPALGDMGNASFDPAFIDPSDPNLYNFNLSDYNFDNRYGALEFGMLGHMSSGAGNIADDLGSMNQSNQGNISYDGASGFTPGYGYGQPFQPWQTMPNVGSRQNSSIHLWSLNNNNNVDAFAVGETASSIAGASEYSTGPDFTPGYSSNTISPEIAFAQPGEVQQHETPLRQSTLEAQTLRRKRAPFPNDVSQYSTNKRRRDTSEVYSSVVEPYPYTQAFHKLINFLQKRFTSNKVLRIAKALASFRPSFISCNKNLNNDDLVFMEKCFQRTLLEYEDFVNQYGTPTVICRRTGEIAAVSKEFCLVTGWTRDVLLGKAPNLNVNTGTTGSGTETGASSKGTVTPRVPNVEIDPGRPQPVYLAELMDQDSVVQFYEDFAELAFGAARSSIIGVPCTLLKYKTKHDPGWGQGEVADGGNRATKQGSDIKTESLMKGEAGTNTLGDGNGKVDAVLCWTVKRDVFDIPMMIVVNFLPVI